MEGAKRGRKPNPDKVKQVQPVAEQPDYLKGIPQEPAAQPKATSPADVQSLPGFNPADVRPKMVTKVMPNVANPNDRRGIMSGNGAPVNVYNSKTGRTVLMNEKAYNRIKKTNPYLKKTHG